LKGKGPTSRRSWKTIAGHQGGGQMGKTAVEQNKGDRGKLTLGGAS